MASIGSTLGAALFGATLRPSQHCRMPFDFGAKVPSERYFYDTRDSCTCCGDSAVFLILKCLLTAVRLVRGSRILMETVNRRQGRERHDGMGKDEDIA